jgi:hypothetical protein
MTPQSSTSLKSSSSPANEINRLHGEIVQLAKISLGSAQYIGQLLTEHKASLNHGEWLPWLKRHIRFSEKTAQNYIRLHERRAEIKSANVSDLASAYKLLNPRQSEPPKKFTLDPQGEAEDDKLVLIAIHVHMKTGGSHPSISEVLKFRRILTARRYGGVSTVSCEVVNE